MNRLLLFTHILLYLFIIQVRAGKGDCKYNGMAASGPIVIYVSPSGNDHSDGSISRPLRSLSSAQSKVRMLKKKGHKDITVMLRGGMYLIANPLLFGPEDSGTDEHPVIWKAYPGEKPVLSGGVKSGTWQLAENGIWQTNLNRDEKLRQLYVNNRPATLAQYKKKIAGIGGFGKFIIKGNEPWAYHSGEEVDGVLVPENEMPEVLHPEELEILSQTTWTTCRLCVREIVDQGDKKAILFEQPFGAISQSLGPGTSFKLKESYTLYNAKEFLTDPGEFYFDRSDKILYYKPRPGEDMLSASVIVPQTESFIQIKGKDLQTHVSNLHFEGLTFAYSSWQLMRVENSYGACGSQSNCLTVKYGADNWHDDLYQSTAIPVAVVEVNAADHIVFERNCFSQIGSMGVNFENDVVSSRIEGNVFQYIGGVAINVGNAQHVYIGKQNGDNEGFGPYSIDNSHDKWPETEEGLCKDILISNNLIRHNGVEHLPSVAIMVYFGHGISINHNDIKYAPYTGIDLGWGWEEWNGRVERSKGKPSLSLRNNSVIGNKVGKVLQSLHDGGGIYLLGCQSALAKDSAQQYWTPVCRNYLYDFGGVTRAGIHPDNGAEYFLFCKNVFSHLPWSLIKVSDYGQKGHCRVENNYANTALYFTEGNHKFASYTVIQGNIDVENEKWPVDAVKIMEESGLESKYRDLYNEIKD